MKTAPADRIFGAARPGLCDREFQVLGRELVRQLHRLVQVARDGDEAVSLEAVARGLLARELRQLPLDLRQRFARDALVRRQQHGGGRIVLGLAEEVGGGEARIGAPSAMISTSLGPASMSRSTSPYTSRLASVTKMFPGPTILSTRRMVFVP